MVALFLFAVIEREARRVVEESGQVFAGLRPEVRDTLPVTAERLLEVFAPLSLVKQRLGLEGVDLVTPATLSPIQAQILDRLRLMKPDAYLHPTITPHPRGAENEPSARCLSGCNTRSLRALPSGAT